MSSLIRQAVTMYQQQDAKKRGEEEKHRKRVLKREVVGEAGEGEWNGVE